MPPPSPPPKTSISASSQNYFCGLRPIGLLVAKLHPFVLFVFHQKYTLLFENEQQIQIRISSIRIEFLLTFKVNPIAFFCLIFVESVLGPFFQKLCWVYFWSFLGVFYDARMELKDNCVNFSHFCLIILKCILTNFRSSYVYFGHFSSILGPFLDAS